MAKKGDKYILSPAEEQLLNDPKSGQILKDGGRVDFNSLPLDLQRQLSGILGESGISDPQGNQIGFNRNVLNQVNGLDAVKQRLMSQAVPAVASPINAVAPQIQPKKATQNEVFAKGKTGDMTEGSPMFNELTSLLNSLRNQYVTPTVRNNPVLGPMDSVLNSIDDARRGNVDLENTGFGPISARNLSNVVKGAKKAVGGPTVEQNVINELKKKFPGVNIEDEILRARSGKKDNIVQGEEGRTASGKRWRIMPDGSIRIIG